MRFIKVYEDFGNINRDEIVTICDNFAINFNSINSDGTVDADYINLYGKAVKYFLSKIQEKNYSNLDKLPLRFGRIEEHFLCNDNYLTTLDGSPHYVGDGFDCSNNLLTSLEGGPSHVVGDFSCQGNKLITLFGSPKIVDGDFFCDHNKLTSFVGAPEIVGGNFSFRGNNIISFEGFPSSVGHFQCSYDSLIYQLWVLFKDKDKIELFNEFDITRGRNIVIDRLNDFLVTIGKKPVEYVNGYNSI
jgi:hypothetical protein